MEDAEPGETLSANRVCGSLTLEEKEKRLGSSQRVEAFRIKYGGQDAEGGLVGIANRLIKGELDTSAYPEQATELRRSLRKFSKAT